MARTTAGRLGVLAWAVIGAACSLSPLNADGKACPCAAGWVCDEEVGLCVRVARGQYAEAEPADADADGPAERKEPKPKKPKEPKPPEDDNDGTDGPADPDAGLDASVPDADSGQGWEPPTDGSPGDASDGPPDMQADAGPAPDPTEDASAEPGEMDPPCVDTMLPGERLYAGNFLCSESGAYRFGVTEDGDLQLVSGETVLWSAGTCCGDRLAMQRDGNLVVYDGAGDALFASDTAGQDGAFLRVEDSGRAVLIRDGAVLWSTDD